MAFLAVLALGSVPASAQPRRSPDVQPLDRVLPQVRSRYPGNFYDADGPFMDEGGNPHYRLKWMTPEGRVMWLDTDARTGRVLGVEHGGRRGGGERYNAPPRDAPPPDFEGRGRPDDGDRGGNPYRGRDRWQHGPNDDRGWGGGGNWNGGGRGNRNGGGHGNWGGNHGGHGGGHHGHGH
ncbi:MAG: PepSY domain-containing protein [Rhizomicrobium sp.]